MAPHASFEADLKTDLKRASSGQGAGSSEMQSPVQRAGAKPPLQWNRPATPMPAAANTIETPQANQKLRRVMTREQGCALEMIGHAVDYLNDCYLQEGSEYEIIDFRGPSMEAIQILIFAQREVLRSLPLTEPLTLRLWNALLRRKSHFKSQAVVPLSSSR
jgi:hypothetical protein